MNSFKLFIQSWQITTSRVFDSFHKKTKTKHSSKETTVLLL